MSTKAQTGYGTVLQRGDGATPENFNTVSEILTITPPEKKRDMKEATNMSSASATREYIAGLLDPGTVALDVNWAPGDAQHAGLLSDIDNGVLRNFKILLPPAVTSKVFSFAAFVDSFKPATPIDDKITATISLRISGPLTFA
jgi:hypothetical protein